MKAAGNYQADGVSVRITPTVELDYVRRGVFPALRSANADRYGDHLVSIEEAEAILADAEQQRRDPSLPRGTPKAFTGLTKALAPAIKHAKGIWDDPGLVVARDRIRAELSRFNVGDSALRVVDNTKVLITAPYGLHCVLDNDGTFVGNDGKRKCYRWGYCGKDKDGEYYFSPNELALPNGECSYLRLVSGHRAKGPDLTFTLAPL